MLPYLGYVEWTSLLKSLADVNYQGDFTYEIHNFTGGMSPEIHQQGVEFSVLVARQMVSEIEKGMKEKSISFFSFWKEGLHISIILINIVSSFCRK